LRKSLRRWPLCSPSGFGNKYGRIWPVFRSNALTRSSGCAKSEISSAVRHTTRPASLFVVPGSRLSVPASSSTYRLVKVRTSLFKRHPYRYPIRTTTRRGSGNARHTASNCARSKKLKNYNPRHNNYGSGFLPGQQIHALEKIKIIPFRFIKLNHFKSPSPGS
jgi:hypothetical protein